MQSSILKPQADIYISFSYISTESEKEGKTNGNYAVIKQVAFG